MEFNEKYPSMRKLRKNFGNSKDTNEPNRVFGLERSGNHFLMESIIYNFREIGNFRKHHLSFDDLKNRYSDFDLNKYKITIQIIRHPIDAAISLFLTPWHSYKTFDEFSENFIDKYIKYFNSWRDIDIYRIKYEDLNLNHIKTMEKIENQFDLERKFTSIQRVPKFVGHYPNMAAKSKFAIKEKDRERISVALKHILEELDY